jgi:hypothetical protein
MYSKWGLNEIFERKNVYVSSDMGIAKSEKRFI